MLPGTATDHITERLMSVGNVSLHSRSLSTTEHTLRQNHHGAHLSDTRGNLPLRDAKRVTHQRWVRVTSSRETCSEPDWRGALGSRLHRRPDPRRESPAGTADCSPENQLHRALQRCSLYPPVGVSWGYCQEAATESRLHTTSSPGGWHPVSTGAPAVPVFCASSQGFAWPQTRSRSSSCLPAVAVERCDWPSLGNNC